MAKSSLRAPFTICFRSEAAHRDCVGRTRFTHFSNQIPPVAVWKTNIGEEDITICVWNPSECLCFAASKPDDIAGMLEIDPKEIQGIAVILPRKMRKAGEFGRTPVIF